MDYFSIFIQMLHANKLSKNTIRIFVSYMKPYLMKPYLSYPKKL